IIPNQNLFRVANEKTTFADAFAMADQVLYSGVACITDLMVKEGLINLDFADVRAVMREMGKAMMGTGEASGDKRALTAAEAAIANPLIDDSSMKGAKGLLISITGGKDLTLFEVDEAATRIREEVDQDANIIVGATFDEALDGLIRVSVVATGIEQAAIARNAQATSAPVANPAPQAQQAPAPAAAAESRLADLTARLRADNQRLADRAQMPETFIPPQAERGPVRTPRMPRLDELPMPAQAEIRQARGEMEDETPQKTRLSLLQRLANVGLGRRDEETEAPVAARSAGPAMPPLPDRRPQKSVAQQIAASEPVSEYARRPAPQGLDMHGRPAPVAPAPQGG